MKKLRGNRKGTNAVRPTNITPPFTVSGPTAIGTRCRALGYHRHRHWRCARHVEALIAAHWSSRLVQSRIGIWSPLLRNFGGHGGSSSSSFSPRVCTAVAIPRPTSSRHLRRTASSSSAIHHPPHAINSPRRWRLRDGWLITCVASSEAREIWSEGRGRMFLPRLSNSQGLPFTCWLQNEVQVFE